MALAVARLKMKKGRMRSPQRLDGVGHPLRAPMLKGFLLRGTRSHNPRAILGWVLRRPPVLVLVLVLVLQPESKTRRKEGWLKGEQTGAGWRQFPDPSP